MKRLHYADNISAALCWQGSLPLYRNHGEWPTDGDGRHSVSRSKNEPGHRNPLIQNQGENYASARSSPSGSGRGQQSSSDFKNSSYYLRDFIHFTKFKLFARLVYQQYRKSVVLQESYITSDFSNSCVSLISSISSISFNTSPRQPSRTQPATSTPEKVGEAWREYQTLFLCPQTELVFSTGSYRSQLFSDSTNRQRSSLP